MGWDSGRGIAGLCGWFGGTPGDTHDRGDILEALILPPK